MAEVVTPAAAVVPAAPAAPATPAAPAVVADPNIARLAELEKAHEQKKRELIVNRRQWENERKTLSERAAKAAEYEKREAQAKLNPPAYLKSIYGDGWYDKLVEARISGAPPADVIADELARMEEKVEKKFADRDAARAKAEAEAQQQGQTAARRQLTAEASDFYEAKGAEYPILETLGNAENVAAHIAQRIEQEYHRTTVRDASGALLRDANVLTSQEAADLIEKDLLAIADRAAGHDKYAGKLRERLTPAKPAVSVAGGLKVVPKSQAAKSQQAPVEPSSNRTTDSDRTQRALATYEARRRK
jgi:hypothetical protein